MVGLSRARLSAAGRPKLSPARERIVADIVATLLPQTPGIDDHTRLVVHSDVAAFATRQIEAMPAFLAWAYRIAITGFDALSLLRHGRRFVSLGRADQLRYLAAWSAAPIGVMRDFVKLIRSCALLAYFDHPDVQPHLGLGVDAGGAAS